MRKKMVSPMEFCTELLLGSLALRQYEMARSLTS